MTDRKHATDHQTGTGTTVEQPVAAGTSPSDHLTETALVEALRNGSEAAFALLIERHHRTMLRVAGFHVSDGAAAEDVVQETWLAVLRGIDRFDGRSSLKTWLFRILTNRAKTLGQRAARVIPVSSFDHDAGAEERAVDPARFLDGLHPQRPGHWCHPPFVWPPAPDDDLVLNEAVEVVLKAIKVLPRAQRAVITLRDVECLTSKEVCNILDLTGANQRVLLHRARSKVRRRLEDHYEVAPES